MRMYNKTNSEIFMYCEIWHKIKKIINYIFFKIPLCKNDITFQKYDKK